MRGMQTYQRLSQAILISARPVPCRSAWVASRLIETVLGDNRTLRRRLVSRCEIYRGGHFSSPRVGLILLDGFLQCGCCLQLTSTLTSIAERVKKKIPWAVRLGVSVCYICAVSVSSLHALLSPAAPQAGLLLHSYGISHSWLKTSDFHITAGAERKKRHTVLPAEPSRRRVGVTDTHAGGQDKVPSAFA